MEIMEGFLDKFLFPCVRLQFVGCSDPLEVHIDTGFNRELLIPESQEYILTAGLRWEGDYVDGKEEEMIYADGTREQADYAYATIKWFGKDRIVTAYIARQTADEKRESKKGRGVKRGIILLGTELLADCTLEINFSERKVLIKKP